MPNFVRKMQRKVDINFGRISKFLNYWKLINVKYRPNRHIHTHLTL